MKFVCTQENLQQGVSLVSRLPSRSVGLPILNNVMLEVVEGVLRVSATNLEIGIVTEVRGKAEGSGGFTVDAKILADYVAVLPKGNVTLELVKNQLSVTCENFHTKIRGQAADEFPIIPQISEEKGVVIAADEFKKRLAQTVFAASLDDMRPEITGVLVSGDTEGIVMVATDSYRLAENHVALKEGAFERHCIVPLRTLQELERVLSSEAGDVEWFVDDNQVMFVTGVTTIVSKLIEGNFPDYQQIVPKSFSARTEVGRADLIQATRAAALFARSGIHDITLEFTPNKGTVEVATANTQVGEQEAVLPGVVTGEALSITFNYKYLLDGLQALSGEKVVFEMNSNAAPAVLTSEKDPGYLYMIMPIKQ